MNKIKKISVELEDYEIDLASDDLDTLIGKFQKYYESMITLKGFAVELEEKSEKADSVDIVKPETYILKSDTSGIKTAAISCGLVDPKDDTSVARANLIRKTDHELALNNAVDAAKEGLVNPQDYFKKTALEAEAKKAGWEYKKTDLAAKETELATAKKEIAHLQQTLDQRGDITPDALVALTQAKDNALAEQERLKQRLDNQIRLAEVAEAKCLELEEALDAQRADIDEAGLTALTQAKDDALAAQLKAEQERDARPATTLKLEQIEALQTRPTQETLDNANQAKEQAEQDLADKQTEIETKDNEIATLIRAKALAETTIKDLEAKIKAKDLEIAQLNEDKGLQNPEGHICLEDHTVKEKLEEWKKTVDEKNLKIQSLELKISEQQQSTNSSANNLGSISNELGIDENSSEEEIIAKIKELLSKPNGSSPDCNHSDYDKLKSENALLKENDKIYENLLKQLSENSQNFGFELTVKENSLISDAVSIERVEEIRSEIIKSKFGRLQTENSQYFKLLIGLGTLTVGSMIITGWSLFRKDGIALPLPPHNPQKREKKSKNK